MRPTLEARGLKESLLQYLSTTYALTDEGVRRALEEFLGDEQTGMFRGPFLRIRTPFLRPRWVGSGISTGFRRASRLTPIRPRPLRACRRN